MHTCAHHSITHNNQSLEATQVSNNRWIDKEIVVYFYNDTALSYEKDEIFGPHLAICSGIIAGSVLRNYS